MIIIRYLVREVLKSQFAVLAVLFLIFFSQKFIRVLESATEGSIPNDIILMLVGLNVPTMAMFMLPLSLYIGILVAYGRLYSNSEITVMNATGIGASVLNQAATILVLIISVFTCINVLWLAPWCNQQTTHLLQQATSSNGLDFLIKGQFQQTPDGKSVVFIDDIKNDGQELKRIFVAQPFGQKKLRPSIIIANSGKVKENENGTQILQLNNGVRYEGAATDLNYLLTQFSGYEATIGKNRSVYRSSKALDAQSTLKLLKQNNLAAKAEFQWRISLILCIPLLVLIVVPLSKVNSRQGKFSKVIPAMLIYLSYFLLLSAGKAAVESGTLPVYIGLWGVNLIYMVLGMWLYLSDSVYIRKYKDTRRVNKNV